MIRPSSLLTAMSFLPFILRRGSAIHSNSLFLSYKKTSLVAFSMSGTGSDHEPLTTKQKSLSLPQNIKVYYWNIAFWRAEVLRAGLFLQGIPFENVTDKEKMDGLESKGLIPFGAFPVLEIDGKILSQTQACATYIGKLGNLYPSNDDILAQANCDEIINGCTDVTDTILSTFRIPKDDVKEAREKLVDPETGRLMKHFKGLNSIVCQDGSEYACGKACGLTVADLAVWRLVAWFNSGKLDHINPELVISFENLKAIYENVAKNEKIQEYQKLYYPQA